MSEERSAKLKLKRRRCITPAQEPEVRVQPSSALNVRQDFAGSWFDEIELTAAEQIWKQVLSSVYPDPSSVGWGAVPSLPDSNLKIWRKVEEKTNTEVFKVGDMSFEWMALPPAFTADIIDRPSNAEIGDNQHSIEHIMKPVSDELPEPVLQIKSTEFLSKQVGSLSHSEGPTSNPVGLATPKNGSSRNIMSQNGTTSHVTKPVTVIKSSSKNVKEAQKSRNGSSRNAKEPQTSQRGSFKHSREQQTAQKPNINLWATVTATKSKIIQDHVGNRELRAEEANPQPKDVIMVDAGEGTSGNRKIKETAEKSSEATGSLDSCPICLMQFPRQFSQLDMDSHLAQCLSETTVDVVW